MTFLKQEPTFCAPWHAVPSIHKCNVDLFCFLYKRRSYITITVVFRKLYQYLLGAEAVFSVYQMLSSLFFMLRRSNDIKIHVACNSFCFLQVEIVRTHYLIFVSPSSKFSILTLNISHLLQVSFFGFFCIKLNSVKKYVCMMESSIHFHFDFCKIYVLLVISLFLVKSLAPFFLL